MEPTLFECEKYFVIVSLVNSYPIYLSIGRAALFDNFKVDEADFHFSTTISFAIRLPNEIAERYVRGILSRFPRFAPLTILPIYDVGGLALRNYPIVR